MDRRSFPTTTDTSKLAGAVDPAAALKDLDSRNNPHSTIRVTTRFSGGELRQHQMNSNSSEPSTCPRLRAQAATFALILDQSRVNSQLIGTALSHNQTRFRLVITHDSTEARAPAQRAYSEDNYAGFVPLLLETFARSEHDCIRFPERVTA